MNRELLDRFAYLLEELLINYSHHFKYREITECAELLKEWEDEDLK